MTRAGKQKFGAKAGEHKLGARAGKYKLGARTRARGQAEGLGPGNTNTPIITSKFKMFDQRTVYIFVYLVRIFQRVILSGNSV